jgi:hypothetical protein
VLRCVMCEVVEIVCLVSLGVNYRCVCEVWLAHCEVLVYFLVQFCEWVGDESFWRFVVEECLYSNSHFTFVSTEYKRMSE